MCYFHIVISKPKSLLLSTKYIIKKVFTNKFTGIISNIMEIQSNSSSMLNPPACVRHMKTLNTEKFLKTIKMPCIALTSDHLSAKFKILKPYMIKLKNVKPPQVENKFIVFLNPDNISNFEDLKDKLKEHINNFNLNQESFFYQDVTLSYEHWSAKSVLSAVLPEEFGGLTGYSNIGHICHLNLKEHFYDYRHIIGQIILDKSHEIKTVVRKIDTIDSTFRTFKMEVLAGIDDMIVEVKENGCVFGFDFSKVYWNPRLSTEHEKVVKKMKSEDYLYDVFAGVGPFTIPAAKLKCNVLANDLNPHSYSALVANVTKNKVQKRVKTYNKDGREFIKEIVKNHLLECWNKNIETESCDQPVYHIVMNLPALAIEFLDAFVGLFHNVDNLEKIYVSPTVYCHCFSKVEDAESDIKERIRNVLGDSVITEIHFVRKVAPNKAMFRVSFSIPLDVSTDVTSEPKHKRLCVDHVATVNK